MLDSGTSHNLMPKVAMERLDLEITKPYKDLYSFYSSRVKCLGLIKDLCVNLAQIPAKGLVMDIIVADITPKYGMILSRSWEAKIQGNLQLDMSYATIPVFNETRILYWESHMKFIVSSQERPNNTPLYSIHSDLDSFILCNEEDIDEQGSEIKTNLDIPQQSNQTMHEGLNCQSSSNPKQ